MVNPIQRPSRPNRLGSRILFGVLAAVGFVACASAAEFPPLIAHWNFDEPSGGRCKDTSGNNWHATAWPAGSDLIRCRGPFGPALSLSGQHQIRVAPNIPLASAAGLSFSAWAKPTDLSHYREIFRKEDGNDRVLFSFQDNGTVLSLGLNVGGYVECDAKIDPRRVRDGQWHHCAATFDKLVMRVFLDGEEIGHLDRPGKIRAGGPAFACIGSSNGHENFQGQLDDLRIYTGPLDGAQIAALCREGQEAIEKTSAKLTENIAKTYSKKASFEETLMECRQRIVENRLALDDALAASLLRRLRTDFPAECERLADAASVDVRQFLSHGDPEYHAKLAEQYVDLLLEYQPLTAAQWQKQTPDDVAKWKSLEAYRTKLAQLQSQGAAGLFSPNWVQLLAEIGPRIEWRPSRYEAVAPYVRPQTPETRDLSAAESQAAIETDWLFQADQRPTPERIRDEIAWTRRLADRLGARQFDAKLDEIAVRAAKLSQPSADLYFEVRRIKRQIMLSNPAVDFDTLLYVDMPFPQGKEWQHETRHRLGYMAVPGARLMTLKGLSPDGHQKQLMPQSPLHGSFWRPDLSFDAKKVVFCFKPHNEKAFHLYEINIDGSGLTQLTDGRFDDLDPIYLADGQHVLFSTTRAHTYVRCMPPTNAFVLARCDRDGKNIYLVSQNNEPDYLPSLMNDGRVIYTRWEYTDKPLWRAQKLWTVNPDGTQVNTYWGNQSVWPDVMKDVRPIPGTRRVLFTGCGHHNWFAGCLGIIDPDRGFNYPDGLTKITADLHWPEVGDGPAESIASPDYHASGGYAAYFSPYPLSDRDFLVSAQRGDRFRLYLMDIDGNRELIHEGSHNIFHAIPVRARTRPPAPPDRVEWPELAERENPRPGVIFSGNVYQNAPAELQSRAKTLRVFSIDPKTYTYWYKRPYISTGPVVSIVQSEGVKRLLGTVPIERDGSVSLSAPPGMPLHFQLLDERGRALQTMRSFVGVMPGEHRGCLGCHESHSRAPAQESGIALRRDPHSIEPPPWSDTTVSYPRYVRPVLDKYCVQCHQTDEAAKNAVDFSPRSGALGFDESYGILTGHPTWGKAYQTPDRPQPGLGIADMLMVEAYDKVDPAAYQTPRPMTKLSFKSRLIELASNGKHYNVQVDPISLQRLIVWVDAMCPYNGEEEIRSEPDPVFQGVDWLSIRPRIQTAPRIVRPGPVD